MIARRFLSAASIAFVVAVGSLALASAPALAVNTHPFTGSFGPEGPLSVGTFASVQGVAIDQNSGDVYVYDTGSGGGSVYKFNAAGEPADFSALGTNAITGVGGAYPDGNELAVDGSNGPAKGDIYVANASHVGVYGADGEPVEIAGKPAELTSEVTTEVPGAPWGESCGVAVDSAGNVYVGLASVSGSHVNEYTPTGAGAINVDYASSLWGVPGEVCNIAVDPAGSVYIDTFETGPVRKYEASQFQTPAQFLAGGEVAAASLEVDPKGSTLASDPSPSSHTLYVDERSDVAEYETSGAPKRLGAFGAAGDGGIGESSFGVAGNAAGEVYAANGSGGVNIYGPSEVVKVQVDSEFATKVTSSSANLGAEINPEGVDTIYTLQYSTGSTELCSAEPKACTTVAAGDLGSGEAGVSVGASIAGLEKNTTYHYRVVAHNSNGIVEGPDRSFTTQSAGKPFSLPDGRAWEMVSPLEKNSSIILGLDGFPSPAQGGMIAAVPDGEAITYVSSGAFSEPGSAPQGAPGASQYLAKRDAPGAWSTLNITPPLRSSSYSVAADGGPYRAFSSDLTAGLLWNGQNGGKGVLNEPLPGTTAPAEYEDYYLHGTFTGGNRAALTTAPGESAATFHMIFEGASPDLRRIVFASAAALTVNATEEGEHPNLYEWDGSDLRLVNLLPEKTMGSPGAVLGRDATGEPAGERPISEDGSRIYFEDEGGIYLREDGSTTIPVGSGQFQAASADGSRAFYVLPSGDLYGFDLASRQSTDLTPGGEVLGVLGSSADGAYVYFVANGVLAGGAHHGDCRGAGVPGAKNGGPESCNLYVWHEGATRFIATLSEDDNLQLDKDRRESLAAANDWESRLAYRTARVSADGRRLVFMSNGDLTGYDSAPVDSADCGHTETVGSVPTFISERCQEVYIYDAAGEGHLACASCDPTGARPVGTSSIPAATEYAHTRGSYQSRVLTEPGPETARVFFDSSDRLVPEDTNSVQDVYQWEEDGTGSCEEAKGCVALISSGTSSDESSFLDASANGDDVFFLTQSQLVPGDTDQFADVYDARAPHVPGEQVGPAPAAPAPACSDTGCQGIPPSAPIFATPSSATFAGVGNFPAQVAKPTTKKKLTKCVKGKVKKKGKCVKRPPKKKRAKKSSRNRRVK
jgi:hypothetical protein